MDNTYTEEEIERCTMHGRREIIFQLRGMIKRSERITVVFQDGQHSFLTVLLDMAEDDGHLYFDVASTDEVNRAFLNAEHSVFTSLIDGIRIQFSTARGRETKIRGQRVFAVPLPKSLLRLQRRDVFRLDLPTVTPYICRIRRGTPEEKELPLHDISVGGIGVLCSEKLEFEPLEKLENCWIDLRDTGVLAVTLEVRYMRPVENRTTGKQAWHMGCRFVGLSGLNETLIQRFMARIQAERKSRLAD